MKAQALILVVCALIAGSALAQGNAAPEVRVSARPYSLPPLLMKVQASLVAVDVVVRHPDGSLVGGLGKENFQIFDNGQPRPLAAFSIATAPGAPSERVRKAAGAPATVAPPPASAAPRSIALYFDDVNTDKNDLGNARNAALRFVREALGPGDRAAIFTASSEQSLDFTLNSGKLLAAIAKIRTHPRASDSQISCPRITAYQAYLIAVEHEPMALTAAIEEFKQCPGQQPTSDLTGEPLSMGQKDSYEPVLAQAESTWDEAQGISFDTLHALRGVVDYLAKQPGSRMLLMASGGFLNGGIMLAGEQDNIVQDALQARVVINSLDAKGLYTDGPGRPINQDPDMGVLPLPTFFFEETSKMAMRQSEDDAMATLAESTGGLFFHNNNDLTVGFDRLGMAPEITYQLAFASGDIPHDGKYHKLKVEIAPKAKDIVQYRPGYFAPAPGAGASAQEELDTAMRGADSLADVPAIAISQSSSGKAIVDVRLDVSRLSFQNDKGRRRQDLNFVAGLFDRNGEFIVGKQGEMDLALSTATWKRLIAQGLSARLSLQAPPGNYRLRVVVEESSDGKISASSQPLRVH